MAFLLCEQSLSVHFGNLWLAFFELFNEMIGRIKIV